jgi:hypothetical protein
VCVRAGDTKRHYEQFVVEAVAMDRLAARQSPQGTHIAAREWAREPVKLFATMYELTETVCRNYWCVLLFLFSVFPCCGCSCSAGFGEHWRLLRQRRLDQLVDVSEHTMVTRSWYGMALATSSLSILETYICSR